MSVSGMWPPSLIWWSRPQEWQASIPCWHVSLLFFFLFLCRAGNSDFMTALQTLLNKDEMIFGVAGKPNRSQIVFLLLFLLLLTNKKKKIACFISLSWRRLVYKVSSRPSKKVNLACFIFYRRSKKHESAIALRTVCDKQTKYICIIELTFIPIFIANRILRWSSIPYP